MAAQLICNQWVAGSTPVTSSKKKTWKRKFLGLFLCCNTLFNTFLRFTEHLCSFPEAGEQQSHGIYKRQ